ncbi:Antizyme inhibitor 2 [Porphyridium purpureum]|uniref:ornithine decarboxylase n=1 Tax=Porphyridium purpureum TaxID=35688 RepID=A0A5J4YU92_PORPP|nr:Antizyme inhibitor 2 [Porphyridium purpureum]|eukprot:POR2586..scf227_4
MTEASTESHQSVAALDTSSIHRDAEERLVHRIEELVRKEQEHSFYIVDLQDVRNRAAFFKSLFPQITPFYALKCNSDLHVLRALAELGYVGFEVSSADELELARDVMLSSPMRSTELRDIVFSNPYKSSRALELVESGCAVRALVVDSADELRRVSGTIRRCRTEGARPEVHLRIASDETCVEFPMNSKFGARPDEVLPLLQLASELGTAITGVSFHVGSGASGSAAFTRSIHRATKVCELARQHGLTLIRTLNLGGGFPCIETSLLHAFARDIHDSLPNQLGVGVIAEPGRFIVESSHTLVVQVIGRRRAKSVQSAHGDGVMDDHWQYYMGDGMYGSFMDVALQKVVFAPCAVVKGGTVLHMRSFIARGGSFALYKSTLWGPTCDSIDCIGTFELPALSVGDWLVFERMGAYTRSLTTSFNSIRKPTVYYQ